MRNWLTIALHVGVAPTLLDTSGETFTLKGLGKNQTPGLGHNEMHKTQKGKTWEALTDTE